MSQKLVAVLNTAKSISGFSGDDFVKNIAEWNKQKAYPFSPIHIEIGTGGVKDNSAEIGALIQNIEVCVNDVTKNTLDVETVEDTKKIIAEIGKFLIEARKIQTNPLASITKNYTQHESKFNDFNRELTKKIDEINEREYQKAEVAIKDYFMEQIIGQGLQDDIHLGMFADFFENKRKNKIFTDKGALSKAIKDQVLEAIRIAHEPIKTAKELEAKKELQSKQFEMYLENIPADGASNVLEASITSLIRMEQTVNDLYPDIADHCRRSIANKKARCEANIRANEAIAQKEAVQNADLELMSRVETIKTSSQNMLAGTEELSALHKELQGIYTKLVFAENKEKVKEIGVSIKQRISEMEKAEIEQSVKVVQDSPKTAQQTKKYMISIHDLEPLTFAKIEAENEEEAKIKMVERFEMHLSMVQLTEIEE